MRYKIKELVRSHLVKFFVSFCLFFGLVLTLSCLSNCATFVKLKFLLLSFSFLCLAWVFMCLKLGRCTKTCMVLFFQESRSFFTALKKFKLIQFSPAAFLEAWYNFCKVHFCRAYFASKADCKKTFEED